jgi:hypothetical protein
LSGIKLFIDSWVDLTVKSKLRKRIKGKEIGNVDDEDGSRPDRVCVYDGILPRGVPPAATVTRPAAVADHAHDAAKAHAPSRCDHDPSLLEAT